MHIHRLYIRNFRNFRELDIRLAPGVTCVIGENNSGKTNLVRALRLVLDTNLSSFYRRLTEHDFHAGLPINEPQQVIISVEFTAYGEKEHECALVGSWEVDDDIARLTYRFRPKASVREELEAEERTGDLDLEDYEWELTGGGADDPSEITWKDDIGAGFRSQLLQAFQLASLDALRDVEQDLRRSRSSPLERVLSTSDISSDEKSEIVEILRKANESIAERETISAAGSAIHDAYAATVGDAFPMNVKIGMADASFASVARSLTLLLSNDVLTDFDPSRNGLGLNNILYLSMLIHYFEKRVASPRTAGQLLIVEEPEAHLHPQLQRTLYGVLKDKPFQTIITTHSTHISSMAPLTSYVVLTNTSDTSPSACCPKASDELSSNEIADLERYLDATRSALLYARKVILVEGPAELFLIPPLVKKVMGVDLDRIGVSVIPIYGTHFDVYTKLFDENGMPKKCAIIADGDLAPSDAHDGSDDDFEDSLPEPPDLDELEGGYVRIFRCKTTFERALVVPGSLRMLNKAAGECGFPNTARAFTEGLRRLNTEELDDESRRELLRSLRGKSLAAAKRAGKARFAQVASKHVEHATQLPKYIRDAIEWLMEDNAPD